MLLQNSLKDMVLQHQALVQACSNVWLSKQLRGNLIMGIQDWPRRLSPQSMAHHR